MIITPIKAALGRKKDFLTVLKQGYLTIDILPYKPGSTFIDASKKSTFILNSRFINKICMLNPCENEALEKEF